MPDVVRGREGQCAGLDRRGEGGRAFGHTAQMGRDQRQQNRTQKTMLCSDPDLGKRCLLGDFRNAIDTAERRDGEIRSGFAPCAKVTDRELCEALMDRRSDD